MIQINKIRLQLTILTICFWVVSCLQATTFHSILVGDSDDQELKKVVRKDLLHMQTHTQEIFHALQGVERLEQRVYRGEQVNPLLMQELAQLPIEPNDIVFFYFSGHGFNTKSHRQILWPFLYFNHGDIGIDTRQIVEQLLFYQPRLLVFFVDCCNNILKPRDFPNFLQREAQVAEQVELDMNAFFNIRHLFQNFEGVIIISSASPGFYSEGTDEKGSCFTNCYLRFFKSFTNSSALTSWQQILGQVQKKLWKRQRPYYDLLITEIPVSQPTG